MKGIFIYNKKINNDKLSGIDKKVISQVEALNSKGIDFKIVEMEGKATTRITKIYKFCLSRLPWGRGYPTWVWNNEYALIDFIYFRRPDSISKDMIALLKKVRTVNPSIKIIMEVPNYPYDAELGLKWFNKPLVFKDKKYRKFLVDVIDRIAIQNEIPDLFGVKTIKFVNGIKISDITEKTPFYSTDDTISICAIASLEPWQGYERIIRGLGEYYKAGGKRKINILVVGTGSEWERYHSLINEYEVEDYIKLLGRLSGKQLDEIYNKSDLALDAFGRYKSGNNLSTSLKSREYLAKGIPIITGCKTDILNPEFPYYLEFSNDNSNVSFERIVKFYDYIYKTDAEKQEVIHAIRKYAEKTCDITKMMEGIYKYLNE